VYSSRFSGGEKMSRVAIDSRNESMRSLPSGLDGIVKICNNARAILNHRQSAVTLLKADSQLYVI